MSAVAALVAFGVILTFVEYFGHFQNRPDSATPAVAFLQGQIGAVWNENSVALVKGGEKIQLSQPGDTDTLGNRFWIRVDRVVYSDGSHPEVSDPWPAGPDGKGQSLMRINSSQYGNDPANWQGAIASPGS